MATHANAPGKWIFWIIIALLVAAVFFFILRPEPEWVDLATAERGPMEVTIREEGKTRVKDRYQISAPVTGYLHRVQMDVGDPVSPGRRCGLCTAVHSPESGRRPGRIRFRPAGVPTPAVPGCLPLYLRRTAAAGRNHRHPGRSHSALDKIR